MEVVTISSDSENSVPETEKIKVDAYESLSKCVDDVYNVDWNDDAYPPISYNSCTNNYEAPDCLKSEKEIKEFLTSTNQDKKGNKNNVKIDDEEIVQYLNELDNCVHSKDVETNFTDALEVEVYNENIFATNKFYNEICKTKQVKLKLSQEEKDIDKTEKEQKKLAKKKLREEKKAEQLRQKAFKVVLTENQKNLKPEENMKFLKVHIDNEIINSLCGGNIIFVLQQNNIQYVVEAQLKSFTIIWSKKKLIKIVNDLGDITEKIDNKDEDQLIYVLNWQNAVELIHHNELLTHIETVKSAYTDKKLTLIIYGMAKYFDYKKHERNKEKIVIHDTKKKKFKESERVYDDAPSISKDQLEFALTDLQLLGKHNCRLLETPEDLSSLVLNITKSLSQIDFKLEKQKRLEDGFGWFTSGENSVKVDKNGNGLLNLWQQQICQFNNVGLDTAQAIVSHFNSPLALMTQYEQSISTGEGPLLLQNIQIRRDAGILSSTRKVGPQLSKKIYKFFMNDNPELEL